MPVDREHLFPAAAVSNLALGTASTSAVVLRTGDLVLSSKSSIKIKLFLDTLFEFLSLSPPPHVPSGLFTYYRKSKMHVRMSQMVHHLTRITLSARIIFCRMMTKKITCHR